MFLWKTIKLIGYLFFLCTFFLVLGTIYRQFIDQDLLVENATLAYNIGSLIGFLISLLLCFLPSLWLIKFANQKIKDKKDNP